MMALHMCLGLVLGVENVKGALGQGLVTLPFTDDVIYVVLCISYALESRQWTSRPVHKAIDECQFLSALNSSKVIVKL